MGAGLAPTTRQLWHIDTKRSPEGMAPTHEVILVQTLVLLVVSNTDPMLIAITLLNPYQ